MRIPLVTTDMLRYVVLQTIAFSIISVVIQLILHEWNEVYKDYNPQSIKIVYDTLRPGVQMNGVFAQKSFARGEVITAYSNYSVVACKHTLSSVYHGKFANEYTLYRFALIVDLDFSYKCAVILSSRFKNGQTQYPHLAKNDRDASYGIFFNEPSPTHAAFFDRSTQEVTVRDKKNNTPNAFILRHVWGASVVASKTIHPGDEITWCYGDAYEGERIVKGYTIPEVCKDNNTDTFEEKLAYFEWHTRQGWYTFQGISDFVRACIRIMHFPPIIEYESPQSFIK